MIVISPETAQAIDDKYGYHFINVDDLSQKVLVIFNYRPSERDLPLSIAFDSRMQRKCWMDRKDVNMSGTNPVQLIEHYLNPLIMGVQFYGFSISPVPQSCFDSLEGIESVCASLHACFLWGDQ